METRDTTQQAVALFDRYAQLYVQKYGDVSGYATGLDAFAQAVHTPAARVLDVACGPGNISRYLLDRYKGWQIQGIDLSVQMLALAQQMNPEATFHCMDARAIGQLGGGYDGIVIGFCLPYLSKNEAITLIGTAIWLLRPQGCLYVSTMEGSYTQSGIQTASTGDTLYMYYHEREYLRAAMETNKARVIYDDGVANGIDLILIAQKGTD